MGRKTREKGTNYEPVDYSDLLKELRNKTRDEKRKRKTFRERRSKYEQRTVVK